MIGIHDKLSLPFFTLLSPQVIKIEVKQVRAPELIVFPLGGGRSLVAFLLNIEEDKKLTSHVVQPLRWSTALLSICLERFQRVSFSCLQRPLDATINPSNTMREA